MRRITKLTVRYDDGEEETFEGPGSVHVVDSFYNKEGGGRVPTRSVTAGLDLTPAAHVE